MYLRIFTILTVCASELTALTQLPLVHSYYYIVGNEK